MTNAFVLLPPLRQPHKYYYYMYNCVIKWAVYILIVEGEREQPVKRMILWTRASREGDEDEVDAIRLSQAPHALTSLNP